MADEELDFEDRFAEAPVETPDDAEMAKKKLELLKLATPPAPPVDMPGAEVPKNVRSPQVMEPSARLPATPPQREVLQDLLRPPAEATNLPAFRPGAEPVPLEDAPSTAQVRTAEVRTVEPPKQAAGPHVVLAEQRAPFKEEISANPMLKMKFAALMSAEEGSDSKSRVALAETALNRGVAKGYKSLNDVLDPRYYEPFQN